MSSAANDSTTVIIAILWRRSEVIMLDASRKNKASRQPTDPKPFKTGLSTSQKLHPSNVVSFPAVCKDHLNRVIYAWGRTRTLAYLSYPSCASMSDDFAKI